MDIDNLKKLIARAFAPAAIADIVELAADIAEQEQGQTAPPGVNCPADIQQQITQVKATLRELHRWEVIRRRPGLIRGGLAGGGDGGMPARTEDVNLLPGRC